MSVRDIAALLVLSVLWGISFLFIRLAVPEFGPLALMLTRVAISALGLLAYAMLGHSVPKPGKYWRPLLGVALLNSALPYLLIATAELHITASLAATLNATTPLFGAGVAAIWLREKFTLVKLLGILLGVAGVSIMLGMGPLLLAPINLLSAGASLLAALSFGIAAGLTRRFLQGISPLAIALYSQLFAVPLLLLALPFTLPTRMPSALSWVSVTALALLCTVLALLLYFGLIQRVGVARATTVTMLSPAFGLCFGVLFLHEPLSATSLVGFGMILLGVALITGLVSSRSAATPKLNP